MFILITGASSYVGAGIYAYLKKSFPVLGTYHTNKLFPELVPLDITDRSAVLSLIKKQKPTHIIHVAANPSPVWCEEHPKEAKSINEDGTKNMVDAAMQAGAKIIFISSFEHANKKTLYGRTKERGEQIVKKSPDFVILRPYLIVGLSPNTTSDRMMNRILRNITEHTPASYDAVWQFHPTWLRHIEEVTKAIIKKDIQNQIIPISVKEHKTRFDLAKDLLSEYKIKATSVHPNHANALISEDLSALKRLGLPSYSYNEMIRGIRRELKGFFTDHKKPRRTRSRR
jgi:dTDP-4-dehydrorhamnose reductase